MRRPSRREAHAIALQQVVPKKGLPAHGPRVLLHELVLLGSGSVEIMSARSASLEMLDDPTNNSATATATTVVSMFQTNSVALKESRAINWAATTDDAVVALSGASYSSAST